MMNIQFQNALGTFLEFWTEANANAIAMSKIVYTCSLSRIILSIGASGNVDIQMFGHDVFYALKLEE